MFRHLVSGATSVTLALLGSLVAAQSAEAQGYSYYALTPCRLVDTRQDPGSPTNLGQTGWTGKLMNGHLSFVTAKGNCGIPATGVFAVSMNVTIVNPSKGANVRMVPADIGTMSTISTLNFLLGDTAIANGAIVPIQATGTTTGPAGPSGGVGANIGTGDVGFYLQAGPANPPDQYWADLVVDITGYFQ